MKAFASYPFFNNFKIICSRSESSLRFRHAAISVKAIIAFLASPDLKDSTNFKISVVKPCKLL